MARYQHCDLVKYTDWTLGIHLVFLPPYSPNLNLIERLWKWSKKKSLCAKYYDSFDKFKFALINNLKQANLLFQDELDSLLNLKFQKLNQNQNRDFIPFHVQYSNLTIQEFSNWHTILNITIIISSFIFVKNRPLLTSSKSKILTTLILVFSLLLSQKHLIFRFFRTFQLFKIQPTRHVWAGKFLWCV